VPRVRIVPFALRQLPQQCCLSAAAPGNSGTRSRPRSRRIDDDAESMAPTEIRLASSPRSTRIMMLKTARTGFGADDDGAAQIAEKDPLNEENQHAAENQIMQHRTGGDADQLGAIIERHHLTPAQAAVAVDFGDLGAHARDNVIVCIVRFMMTIASITSSS